MDQVNVITVAGASLIGAAFSWCLYGCLMVQYYVYFTTSATSETLSKDPVWLVSIVGTLLVLESGFTFLMTHSTWVYLIDWYGLDPYILQNNPVPWSYAICPAITGLVASIVQVYLAWRIWSLSCMSRKGSIIALVIIALASIEVILCFVVTAKFLQSQDPQQVTEGAHTNLAYLVVGFACDIIITFTMTTLLWRAKAAATGALNSEMNEIILRSFETGFVITAAAFVAFILFFCSSANSLGLILVFSISRLYTVTLLASLNGRRHLPGNWIANESILSIAQSNTQLH